MPYDYDNAEPADVLRRKRLLRSVGFIGRFATAIVLCTVLLRTIDLPKLLEQLHTVDWRWLLVSVLSQVVGIALSTYRWQVMLEVLGEQQPYRQLLLRYWSGTFFSVVLPGVVGGDIVRVGSLARAGIPLSVSALSVIPDRAIGLWMNTLTGLLSSLWPSQLPHRDTLGYIFGLLVGGGLLIVWLAPALADYLPARLRRYSTLGGLLGTHRLTYVLALAALFQVFVLLHAYAIAQAVHVPIAALVWGLYLPAVILVTVLPISLNGLGVREAALVVFLTGIDVSRETAVLIGFLMYVMTVVSSLPGGLATVAQLSGPQSESSRPTS